ncbi:MAG: alpha/beta fold hydrolase [Sphaerochaetaceae bacterium]|nr:alpha/beta fold hydrolase [Sphaerochaetaceae bacterium]
MTNNLALTVRKCAKPITLVHEPKANKAVVCLHGYTGYPGELALPAKELFSAGFDVFVPRYPGHGTNAKDFMSTRRDDWIGEAERVYRKAADDYEEVALVGHSMGGAIATILAERYGIKKMVLYAPALSLPTLPRNLIVFMSLFMKRKKQSWQRDLRYTFFDERDEDDDAYLGAQYWSWIYPRQLRELALIKDEAVKALASLETDTLVFTGGGDETVPQDVGILVIQEGKGNNNWIHLPKATHLIPYDFNESSRIEAMEGTVTWLSAQNPL